MIMIVTAPISCCCGSAPNIYRRPREKIAKAAGNKRLLFINCGAVSREGFDINQKKENHRREFVLLLERLSAGRQQEGALEDAFAPHGRAAAGSWALGRPR